MYEAVIPADAGNYLRQSYLNASILSSIALINVLSFVDLSLYPNRCSTP